MTSAGGISIHAVDVATGRVAQGLSVLIQRLDPEPTLIAQGRIGPNGLLAHPSANGEFIIAGLYEVNFAVGEYLSALGRSIAFLDHVPFRFRVLDASEHYHLPFKFTPFGFSLFRGA